MSVLMDFNVKTFPRMLVHLAITIIILVSDITENTISFPPTLKRTTPSGISSDDNRINHVNEVNHLNVTQILYAPC